MVNHPEHYNGDSPYECIKVLKALPCCYNCKHSYTRMGLSLYCNNREKWVKEASVQPCGVCQGYEVKES